MSIGQSLQTDYISDSFSKFWNALIKKRETSQGTKIDVNMLSVIFQSKQDFDMYIIYIDKWFEIWLYKYLSATVSDYVSDDQKAYVFDKFDNNFFHSMVSILNDAFVSNYSDKNVFYDMMTELELRLTIVVRRVQVSTSFLDMHSEVAETKEEVTVYSDVLNEEINEVKEKLKTANDDTNDLSNKVSKAVDALNEYSKKNAEVSIAILGIFAAIIMVFFGDISVISNVTTAEPIFLIFLTMVLYDTVILLFFLIARMTAANMQCNCLKSIASVECGECLKRKHLRNVCLLRNKYPYVYWVNLLFICSLMFLYCKQLFLDMQYTNVKSMLYAGVVLSIFIAILILFEFVILGILMLCENINKTIKEIQEAIRKNKTDK